MAPRREILDSDDEDEALSPLKSPISHDPSAFTVDAVEEPKPKSLRSTDPDFVEAVYGGQIVNVAIESHAIPIPAVVGEEESTGGRPFDPKAPSPLSLTDSVADQESRDIGGSHQLPDILETTASGSNPSIAVQDAWDVPSTADAMRQGGRDAGPSSSRKKPNLAKAKAYGKRKRGQQSSPAFWEDARDAKEASPVHAATPWLAQGSLGQADEDEDKSPVSSRKRRKRNVEDSILEVQGVDLVTAPEIGDAGDIATLDCTGSGTPYNTAPVEAQPVLEVSLSQNRMTMSQRKQFRPVTSSEELYLGGQRLPSMDGDLQLPEGHHRSSAAETRSTIAYTTPSEFASSKRHRVDEDAGQAETQSAATATSRRKRTRTVIHVPSSSPDIIAQPTSRSKRVKSAPNDETWNPGEMGFHGEQTSSSRRYKVEDSLPDTDPGCEIPRDGPSEVWHRGSSSTNPISLASSAVQQDAVPGPDVEPPKTQKKRGRKKKEIKAAEATLDAEEGLLKVEPSQGVRGGAPDEKPKKKRGRPRKSDEKPAKDSEAPSEAAVNETVLDEEHTHEDPAAERTPAKASRSSKANKGKNTKQAEKLPHPRDMPAGSAESRALSDKSNTQTSQLPTLSVEEPEKPTLSTDDAKENRGRAAEQDAKPNTKDATTDAVSNGQGKVGYRVGLSKRSRIAPLLKIIRK